MKNSARFISWRSMSVFCFIIISFGCSKDDSNPDPTDQRVFDIDGNEYPIAKMCDGKIWMLKNLNVTRFRNGDFIPNIDLNHWSFLYDGKFAYCNFDDSEYSASIYGRLYNWYAVGDERNLAPAGWHVATDEEWNALVLCNGGENFAGDKLKESGDSHWLFGNNSHNESGFTALPGGFRVNQSDQNGGYRGIWWTASGGCSGLIFVHSMVTDSPVMTRYCEQIFNGFSVRCVKD